MSSGLAWRSDPTFSAIPPAGRPLYLLPGLDVEISASQVRDQIRTSFGSKSTRLPEPHIGTPASAQAVFEAIRSRGLYR